LPELISWHAVTTLWMVWLRYWIASAWGVRRNERGETAGQRLITALIVGHWLKSRREESLLASQFGTEYEEYRTRTGALLPRLR